MSYIWLPVNLLKIIFDKCQIKDQKEERSIFLIFVDIHALQNEKCIQ